MPPPTRRRRRSRDRTIAFATRSLRGGRVFRRQRDHAARRLPRRMRGGVTTSRFAQPPMQELFGCSGAEVSLGTRELGPWRSECRQSDCRPDRPEASRCAELDRDDRNVAKQTSAEISRNARLLLEPNAPSARAQSSGTEPDRFSRRLRIGDDLSSGRENLLGCHDDGSIQKSCMSAVFVSRWSLAGRSLTSREISVCRLRRCANVCGRWRLMRAFGLTYPARRSVSRSSSCARRSLNCAARTRSSRQPACFLRPSSTQTGRGERVH
jgi:hypothetical protein